MAEAEYNKPSPAKRARCEDDPETGAMADDIKRLMEQNRVQLVQQIVLDTAMWNHLRAANVLSVNQQNEIKLNKIQADQIGDLLDFLVKRSDEAVFSFCMALRLTNQGNIVDGLLTPSGPTKTSPTSNLPGGASQFEREPEVKKAKIRVYPAEAGQQDEQTGAMGTPESETGLDTVRLHFTDEDDYSFQNSRVTEVAKLKKLKHLLIETEGVCEVVVERPLDMLLMKCWQMKEGSAARVIKTSHASKLCLYSKGLCFLPESTQLSKDIEILLMSNVDLHIDTVSSIEARSSLRVITGLRYNNQTATGIHRLIEKTPDLKAVGLMLFTDKFIKLSSVVSKSSIACLSLLNVDPDNPIYMEFIRVLLDNASLRELWLDFCSTPSDAVLAELAEWVCSHGCLTTLSLVSTFADSINVTYLLEQLVGKAHSLRHIYANVDVRSVERDVVTRFTGELRQVRGDDEAAFFTSLVYSDYLLTPIPSHVKEVLTRRYVSPD